MYAVLKQDIVSDTSTFHVLAEKGRVYRLGDIVATLALSDITDAGVDMTVCVSWSDAVMSYRVHHMNVNPAWEGDDDDYAWNPSVSRAMFVGEAAARDAALSEA